VRRIEAYRVRPRASDAVPSTAGVPSGHGLHPLPLLRERGVLLRVLRVLRGGGGCRRPGSATG
jgi:hypothetical protein